jgi:hypothetical protein
MPEAEACAPRKKSPVNTPSLLWVVHLLAVSYINKLWE